MKKGFTLIELMGVIAILMLILLLAIPAVTKVISTSEKTIYDIQIDRILNAAYDYSLENINVLPERNQKSYVSLAELIYNDYIDRLVNPNTKEFFPDDYLISIENVGKNRSNGSKYSKKSGSYIYKVEYDEMSEAEYTSNKPKIYLESTGGNELTRVDDSYTTIMNQDAVFEENNYVVKVYDKDDNDITDNVKLIRNVVFNDELPIELLLPNHIMLLNFNYTHTADLYCKKGYIFTVNQIHGDLNNPKSVIFGYGDELDNDYRTIVNKNENKFLENIKSIKYLEADNYRRLLSFIEAEPYQIVIMGHSCGNSDRTLLNTLFEHKNCVSIKPYYYKWGKGEKDDNYIDLVQNISRNFKDMKLMRDRVVNKTYCKPLVSN